MSVRGITPFVWYDTEAHEAAKLYVSLFPDSRITQVSYYGDHGPGPKGTVMVVAFELMGRRFSALNGGPAFKLSEAFSLTAECTEQADIDRLWSALGEGGTYQACGWLKDRFGLSWQINYAGFSDLLTGDPARAERVMGAMFKMSKRDIAALKKAAAG